MSNIVITKINWDVPLSKILTKKRTDHDVSIMEHLDRIIINKWPKLIINNKVNMENMKYECNSQRK